MDGWMDGWMGEWMDGWMDEWMDECIYGACVFVWMGGWVGGWVDGWKLQAVSEPCLHVPSCGLKRALTQDHLLGTTRVRGGAPVGPRPVASLVRPAEQGNAGTAWSHDFVEGPKVS